ncbi:hypothetical protein LCGC14_2338160 [marine sediment metagenome]|uniref:Uncharacterized protein n=1 Tax=marine sediment metagenome TaxID=412755 RepID=A0A0F9CDM8_9ZZZZ
MNEWNNLHNRLHPIRNALLEANINLEELPPFAVSKKTQYNLLNTSGLNYDLYQRIREGEFHCYGFKFVVMEALT